MKVNEIRVADPERIREWVEEKGGRPAQVVEGKNEGELRIDFPNEKHNVEIEHISWKQFFEEFDKRNLIFTKGEKLTIPEREA